MDDTEKETVADVNTKAILDTVDWSKPPTVSDLKNDLIEANSGHTEQVNRMQGWLDLLHVEGKAKIKKREGFSNYQPKTIRKQSEWRYGSLTEPFLSNDDLIKCDPVTSEDVMGSRQSELLLNSQFRTSIDKTQFFDSLIRALTDEGTGIVRTGWNYTESVKKQLMPIFEYVPDNSPKTAYLVEKLAQLYNEDPEGYEASVPPEHKKAFELTMESEGEAIFAPIEVGEEEIEIPQIVDNHPTAELWNASDVIIDPTCKGIIKKARFCIFRFETSLAELNEDSEYVNLDVIKGMDLQEPSTTISDSMVKTPNFKFQDKSRQKFYAYEYWGFWDVNGDNVLVPIKAVFVNNVMIFLGENPFPHKKLPLVVIPYLPVKESLYGEPDAVLIEDNQHVIGAVSRGMIDLMARSANGQTGVSKDSLDFINRKKFMEGRDYEFNPGRSPGEMFYTHQYPEIPSSAYNMIQMHALEAESITGIKAFSGGLSGDSLGKNSARGVQGVLDAAAIRESGILRRVANGIIEISRHWISMNAVLLSEKEIIRITNDDFAVIRRDNLSAKIDIKVKINSVDENNQKASELAFMLQTIGPNSDPAEVRLIRAEIARLRKMPELAKKIEDYRPEPDPMAQAIQELELLKLQKELNLVDAKTIKEQSSAILDQARADKLGSEKDLKDLDFVEQESGTKHARDVDRITAQADAQTSKSVIESMLPKS